MGAVTGYEYPPEERIPVYEECPICHGEGHVYVDGWTGVEVSREIWEMLPEEFREKDICEHCHGHGEIEVD